MARIGQFTFAGGELDPLMHGRVDLAQFANSVSMAKNFFAKKYGGLANRPGLRYVTEPDGDGRLMPFEFGKRQSYVLVLEDRSIRWVAFGGELQVDPTDAAVTNGDFSDSLNDWDDQSTGDAEVTLGQGTAMIDPAEGTPIGDMTDFGGLAAAFDGELEKVSGECAVRRNKNSARIGIDWGIGDTKTVVGVRLYGSTDQGFRKNENPAVTFILQGSTDAFAASVVELGRRVVTDTADAQIVEMFDDIVTSTDYRYHRVVMQGGSGSRNAVLAQVQFFEATAGNGKANLVGADGEEAVLEQDIATTDLDQETVVSVLVEGEATSRCLVRVGSASGGTQFLDDYALTPGRHLVAFTPGASPFYLQFVNPDTGTVTVSQIAILGSGAAAAVPLAMASPYPLDDLPQLNYTNSRDVMTLVHPLHRPRELVRRGHLSWSLRDMVFTSEVPAPTDAEGTLAAGSGSTTHRYVVTATREGKESLPSEEASVGSAPSTLSSTNYITVEWTAVADAEVYNVYKYRNGLFGYIGGTETTSFVDDGLTPAVDDTPPRARDPFSDPGLYPAGVDYFQQRLGFGGGLETPETGRLSRVADFRNFAVSEPVKDDDAITFTPAGNKMGEIRHLLGARSLLIFTSQTVWALSRGDNGLTPALEGGLEPADGPPAAYVRPISVGRNALYVEDGGRACYDMQFEFTADGFLIDELTLTASHLFRRSPLREWTWANRPWRLIWGVCEDGTAVSCTYERQQQVRAWCRHETAGDFRSVVAVDEGDEDAVYFLVRRRINGSVRWFVERLASRQILDVRDSFFVDCGLSYDDPYEITGITLAEPVVVTAPGHDFEADDLIDLADIVGTTELNDLRFRVGVVDGDTFTLLKDIPSDPPADDYIDGSGMTPWLSGGKARKALDTFYAPHLEGETVSILADGGEEAMQTAGEGGLITLLNPASRVHIGLPYNSDMLTLPLSGTPENRGGPDLTASKKAVKAAYLAVDTSRRIQAGPSFDRLDSFKPPAPSRWDTPEQPLSAMLRIPIEARWGEQPRIAVRQSAPLPVELLSIIPEFDVGG